MSKCFLVSCKNTFQINMYGMDLHRNYFFDIDRTRYLSNKLFLFLAEILI